MTPQKVFDKVVLGLRAQGCKSEMGDLCRYRGPEGTKCAAGLLIKNSEYSAGMETHNIKGIIRSSAAEQRKISEASIQPLIERLKPHIDLIFALQCAHDFVDVENWETEFRRIADAFKLTYTAP
jgi:hypothetical protein